MNPHACAPPCVCTALCMRRLVCGPPNPNPNPNAITVQSVGGGGGGGLKRTFGRPDFWPAVGGPQVRLDFRRANGPLSREIRRAQVLLNPAGRTFGCHVHTPEKTALWGANTPHHETLVGVAWLPMGFFVFPSSPNDDQTMAQGPPGLSDVTHEKPIFN